MSSDDVPVEACDNQQEQQQQQQQPRQQQQQQPRQQQQQQPQKLQTMKDLFLKTKNTLEEALTRNERDVAVLKIHLEDLNKQWRTLSNCVNESRPAVNSTCITDEEEEEEVRVDRGWITVLETDYRGLKLRTLSHLKTISDESNSATESALECLQQIDNFDKPAVAGATTSQSQDRGTLDRRLARVCRHVYDLEHSTYCSTVGCQKVECKKYKNIRMDTQHEVFRQYILLCFFHAKHCRRATHSACVLCRQYKGVCHHQTTKGERGKKRKGSKYCTRSECLVPYCAEFREKISLHENAGLPVEVLEQEFN